MQSVTCYVNYDGISIIAESPRETINLLESPRRRGERLKDCIRRAKALAAMRIIGTRYAEWHIVIEVC